MGKIDSNYYNSDLNKYIGENLPKTFTSIDIDLLQIKKSKKILRIGEYKHINERVGYQQKEALKQLAYILSVANTEFKVSIDFWSVECVILRGNEPYDSLQVTDLVNDHEFTIYGNDNVNEYLSLEVSTEEAYSKSIKKTA